MKACTGLAIDVFYERSGLDVARRACASCAVIDECRRHTMATEPLPRVGYRAGMTAKERIALAGERAGTCDWCGLPLAPRRKYCDVKCMWAAMERQATR